MSYRAAARHLGGVNPRSIRTAAPTLTASVLIAVALSAMSAGPALAANSLDLGDAPASYDVSTRGPARATIAGPRLGTAVSADPADPAGRGQATASKSARSDTGDDALAGLGRIRTGRLATFSSDIAVSRVARTARVCGWVDFDRNGSFSEAERSCTNAAPGSTTARLSWAGRPARAGASDVRLRIGSDATQVEQPTGASDTGEVEDYPVTFLAAPDEPEASITLTKTAVPTTVSAVGQVIAYAFVAKNTGDEPLTRVEVSDELLGLSALSCDGAGTLAANASLRCTATREVTQDDLDFGSIFNFAGVTAEAPGGDPSDASDDVTALDDATVTAKTQPDLKITSRASATGVSEGTRVSWTFAATNTGNVTLSGVRISTGLKRVSPLKCTPKADANLAPDATMTCTADYTVTRADAERQSVTLRATVRGDAPYRDETTSSDDVVATISQRLTVVKPTSPAGGSGNESSTSPTSNPTEATGDGLADTGGPGISMLLGFAALSLTGAATTALDRRRRRG